MPSTTTRPIAGRISADVHEQIGRLAAERGITRSQVVGALLSAVLPPAPAEPAEPAPGPFGADAAAQAELRERWTDPSFVAEQLKVAIENPEVFGERFTPRKFVMEVLPWRQLAIDMFGEPVLLAATRPSPDCRWCAAIRYSKRHGKPMPRVNAANKAMLGEMCEKHGPSPAQRHARIRSLTAQARARSAEARALSATRTATSYWKPLLASATITKRDDQGRPVRLVTGKDASGRRRILVHRPDGWVQLA